MGAPGRSHIALDAAHTRTSKVRRARSERNLPSPTGILFRRVRGRTNLRAPKGDVRVRGDKKRRKRPTSPAAKSPQRVPPSGSDAEERVNAEHIRSQGLARSPVRQQE